MEPITHRQVLDIAKYSECSRRKYGALVTDRSGWVVSTGYNKRVGSCCGNTCVRDRLGMAHGQNTDAGGEIHAEQAALVSLNSWHETQYLFVAGMGPDGTPYNGFENRPCYSCARMIVYAGFERVFLPFDGEWESISMYDIMENWEASWRV